MYPESSPALRRTEQMAFGRAVASNPTYENILMALITNEVAASIMHTCNVDLELLQSELARHESQQTVQVLADMIETRKKMFEGGRQHPHPAVPLEIVWNAACLYVRDMERPYIHGGDMLAAFFEAPYNFATSLLEKHGLTRSGVIDCINSGAVDAQIGADLSEAEVAAAFKKAAPVSRMKIEEARPPFKQGLRALWQKIRDWNR